jgi:hypothetical protein
VSRNGIEDVPHFGSPVSFTHAVGRFVDLMRGLPNTPEHRQEAYGKLDEATGAALMKEANRQGWSAGEIDERLAELAGDTEAAEGSLDGGAPFFWK